MSDDIQSKLSKAFEHVEGGRVEDAVEILKPVLEAAPDNADAWWIYLHAVSDPAEARRALGEVLRIAPDYPGAAEIQDLMNIEFPSEGQEREALTLGDDSASLDGESLPPVPLSMPETPSRLPEPIQRSTPAVPQYDVSRPIAESSQRAAPRRSMGGTLVILGVVAASLVLVFLLLNPSPADSVPTLTVEATSVVDNTTETPPSIVAQDTSIPETLTIAEATTETTEESISTPPADATNEVTPDVLDTQNSGTVAAEVRDALADFRLAPNAISLEELGTGIVMVANVCSSPGREARTLLPAVMQALAGVADAAPDTATAVGTRLVNCEDGTSLVTVSTLRDTAIAYASGGLTSEEYAAQWTAIR
ncbi:MAG: tetratricopeptide repeat protein [Anaerolineae bacterium]|nr:tetratricopeptide repeat protein [Anaerolineae bacterium]NUQ02503.1 tetratricopeptide repeat protein [Anaerolineae bacterium]